MTEEWLETIKNQIEAKNELQRQKQNLAERRLALREKEQERKENKQKHRTAKLELVQVNVRCPFAALPTLRYYAHQLALVALPDVTYEDVARPLLKPLFASDTVAVFRLGAHPQDREKLRAFGEALCAESDLRPEQIAKRNAERFQSLLQDANQGDKSWPEGDPK